MKIDLKNICSSMDFLWQFSRDDFKRKYAGSAAGVAWAIIQPLSTIVLYWFVFQVGFKSSPVTEVPFTLWLVSGLLPWLFFSDAVANTTPALVEYSYLVKKVKFNVEILPLVKIVSGLFVHLILLLVVAVMFLIYGFAPNMYYLQLAFYLVYTLILLAGISYFVCAIYVFLKDTVQIISILLQVIFWATPIVWSLDIMPEIVQKIISKTPFNYLVRGYRDAFVNRVWFWQHGLENIWQWLLAIGILFIGRAVFKKFEKHFADVL